jgi:hypothetical protein
VVTDETDNGTEEGLDLSQGMVPHHNLGPVTGYDHDSGLPIVKRNAADPQPASKPSSAGEKQEAAMPEAETKPELKPSGAKPMLKPAGAQPSELKKGAPVTLPDGSKATVAHLIDNKSVRIRTEDGRNIVTKISSVKADQHTIVHEHVRRLPG